MMLHMLRLDGTERTPPAMSEAEFNANCKDVRGALAQFFVISDGRRLYPGFLADRTLERRQMAAVVKLLGDLDNFTKWRFFVSGKGSLGGLTPLEALRRGKVREVKVAAEGFATR